MQLRKQRAPKESVCLRERTLAAIDSANRVIAAELYSAFSRTNELVPIDVVALFYSGEEFVEQILPYIEVDESGSVLHIRIDQFEAIRGALRRKASCRELAKLSRSFNMNQKLVYSDGKITIRRPKIKAMGRSGRYNSQYTYRKWVNGREVLFPVGTRGAEGIKIARKIGEDIGKGLPVSELRKKYHPNSKVLKELEKDEVLGSESEIVNVDLSGAIEQLVQVKVRANRSDDTIRQAEMLLGHFKAYIIKRYNPKKDEPKAVLLRDISEGDVKDFLYDFISDGSFDHYYTAVNGLFRWASDRDFIDRNPCRLIVKKDREPREVQVLSCQECIALLKAAQELYNGELLATVALMIFAGVRPDSEIKYLTWDSINLEDGEMRVIKGKRKIKRMVVMTENLVAWLKTCDQTKPIYSAANFKRRMARVRVAAGFRSGLKLSKKQKLVEEPLKPWVRDYPRHTAISCHLRITEDYGRTATWAGNSKDVIKESYDGLVPRRIADEFWAIYPDRSSVQ